MRFELELAQLDSKKVFDEDEIASIRTVLAVVEGINGLDADVRSEVGRIKEKPSFGDPEPPRVIQLSAASKTGSGALKVGSELPIRHLAVGIYMIFLPKNGSLNDRSSLKPYLKKGAFLLIPPEAVKGDLQVEVEVGRDGKNDIVVKIDR